jgi:hypothetical protein
VGREANVRKERTIRATGEVVYATAREVKERAALVERALKAGLVLPGIKRPDIQIVKLTDD